MPGGTSSSVSMPCVAVLLAAVFTGLRLAHMVSWSWWWVLSPLWALAGIVLILFAGIVATAALDARFSRKN
ncbi:MAG: hypothetical protein JO242_11440 [Streptosporangiaceae bacterium]|nr:hypothetical protein [Streptosporangiaceae bacterium]